MAAIAGEMKFSMTLRSNGPDGRCRKSGMGVSGMCIRLNQLCDLLTAGPCTCLTMLITPRNLWHGCIQNGGMGCGANAVSSSRAVLLSRLGANLNFSRLG